MKWSIYCCSRGGPKGNPSSDRYNRCNVCNRSSIPGADNFDSGFQPSRVGKMSSSQYVDGWPLQKTANVNRAAVWMATCGLFSRRRKLPHVCFVGVSTSDLDIALVTKASSKWLFKFTFSLELVVTGDGLFYYETIFYAPYFPVTNKPIPWDLKMTVVVWWKNGITLH